MDCMVLKTPLGLLKILISVRLFFTVQFVAFFCNFALLLSVSALAAALLKGLKRGGGGGGGGGTHSYGGLNFYSPFYNLAEYNEEERIFHDLSHLP